MEDDILKDDVELGGEEEIPDEKKKKDLLDEDVESLDDLKEEEEVEDVEEPFDDVNPI